MITIWVYLCINTFLLNLTAISRGLDCGEMKTTHCLGRILPQLSFEAPKMTMSDSDCCVYFKPKGNVKYFPGVCEFGVCEFGVCVCGVYVCEICSSQGDSDDSFIVEGVCMFLPEIFLPWGMIWAVSVHLIQGCCYIGQKWMLPLQVCFFLGQIIQTLKNIRISISMWQPNTPISQRWIDNAAGTDE